MIVEIFKMNDYIKNEVYFIDQNMSKYKVSEEENHQRYSLMVKSPSQEVNYWIKWNPFLNGWNMFQEMLISILSLVI